MTTRLLILFFPLFSLLLSGLKVQKIFVEANVVMIHSRLAAPDPRPMSSKFLLSTPLSPCAPWTGLVLGESAPGPVGRCPPVAEEQDSSAVARVGLPLDHRHTSKSSVGEAPDRSMT